MSSNFDVMLSVDQASQFMTPDGSVFLVIGLPGDSPLSRVQAGGRREEEKTTITAESFDKQVAHKIGQVLRRGIPAHPEEAGGDGKVLRRGEAAREDPDHLGGEDHRGAVPGASVEGAQGLTDLLEDQTSPTPTSMIPTYVSGA